jgi:hypothetical protein
VIGSYRFGEITVGDRKYEHDVIIDSESVRGWWRKKGHEVSPADIEAAVDSIKPEVIVIGSGNSEMMAVPAETRKWLESRGIEVIVAATSDACTIFNQLCGSRKAAAALHLTC